MRSPMAELEITLRIWSASGHPDSAESLGRLVGLLIRTCRDQESRLLDQESRINYLEQLHE